MSNNYYVLTAKSCTKLEDKYSVIGPVTSTEAKELSKEFIVEGPMDQIDAMITKDDHLKDLIIHHVRWSVLREGLTPPGTFAGVFFDNEKYCVVEKGGKRNFFKPKRGFLTGMQLSEVTELAEAATNNTLHKMASILYTDLDEKTYQEIPNILKTYTAPEKKDEEIHLPVEVEDNASETTTLEDPSTIEATEVEPIEPELVIEPKFPAYVYGVYGIVDDEGAEEEVENTVDKTEVIIPGISCKSISYNKKQDKWEKNATGAQVHRELISWLKNDADVSGIRFTKIWVDLKGPKVIVNMVSFAQKVVVNYIPRTKGKSEYTIDMKEFITMVKEAIMKSGLVLTDKKGNEVVRLDDIGSDPRSQSVCIECDHRDIPSYQKPERDMRDNLVLEEKTMDPVNIPDFDPSEYTVGQILDRIKVCYKEFLKDNIINLQYVSKDMLGKIIGPHSFKYTVSTWFGSNCNSLAKKIDAILKYDGSFDEEVIMHMCMNYDKLKGFGSVKKDLVIDLDRSFALTKAFLNKEFMNDKFFANNIKNDDELILVTCASSIASNYIETVLNYGGLPTVSIQDAYDTIKNEFKLKDENNIFALMHSAGFPKAAIYSYCSADFKPLYKTYDFDKVFSKESDISEEEFCAVNRAPKYWKQAEPIVRHFFREGTKLSLYDIIAKYYSKVVNDDIISAIVTRSASCRADFDRKNRKEK